MLQPACLVSYDHFRPRMYDACVCVCARVRARLCARLPKQFLLGWLSHPRPAHGVNLWWRDKVRRDLKTFHINESTWYALAHNKWSGCSNTPGKPHRCHCNCSITCWCVVCAQNPSGDHRIWQDTTVTVFVVAPHY